MNCSDLKPSNAADSLGQVCLWHFVDDGLHPLDLSSLSQEERDRRNRYRIADKRRQFEFTRSVGRELFADLLGISPEKIIWPARGIPRVERPDRSRGISASISHSGGQTLIATGPPSLSLGVDIEPAAALTKPGSLAAVALTSKEQELLSSVDALEQGSLLTQIWTVKEAVLKSRGECPLRELKSVEIVQDVPRLKRGPVAPFFQLSARSDPGCRIVQLMLAAETRTPFTAALAVRWSDPNQPQASSRTIAAEFTEALMQFRLQEDSSQVEKIEKKHLAFYGRWNVTIWKD